MATGISTISGSNGASIQINVGNIEVANAGDVLTISGGVSSTNYATAVNKTGAGLLVLSGSNTYSGPTTINQGKLVLDGWLTNSAVTVNSGGTLSGTGSLTSVTVNAGGKLAPGDLLGVLHLSGNLTLALGATMDYDLNGVPIGNEVLMPTGQLILSGQQFADFNVTPQAGFGPGTYTLIDAGSISGSLGASTSGTIGGYPATLAVQSSGSDQDLVLNVTPEPSTLALLAAGAMGLAGYVWRQRRRRRSLSLAGVPADSRDDETDSQADGPAILALPSRRARSARRAA